MKICSPRNSHISLGKYNFSRVNKSSYLPCPREIWLFSGEQIFISPLCKGNKCIMLFYYSIKLTFQNFYFTMKMFNHNCLIKITENSTNSNYFSISSVLTTRGSPEPVHNQGWQLEAHLSLYIISVDRVKNNRK
jgi:hypothetical protein